MIIIEGMDNSGKTTLAKTLASHYNWPLEHSPGYCSKMVDWAKSTLLIQGHRIYDRHPCISEQVYGPILRDKDEFKTPEGGKVMKLFIKKSPLIIFCKPPDSVIVDDMGDQMKGVKYNSFNLIMAYNRLMAYLKYWGLLVYDYDYTEHSENGWVNLFAAITYKEEERRELTW